MGALDYMLEAEARGLYADLPPLAIPRPVIHFGLLGTFVRSDGKPPATPVFKVRKGRRK